MKGTVAVLFLVVGFANSAFLDLKSPHSNANNWDDEDSMTIVPTPSPTKEPEVTTQNETEDLKTEEQQRPKFLSLIPPGTHQAGGPSKSDQEELKYLVVPTADENEEVSSTPVSSEESTSQSSDSGEGKLKHVQLGKIPLTVEMIPMREEKQQLLGRDDTNPIGFFPAEQPYVKDDGKNDDETVETTEIITGKPVPELQLLPEEPSRYMVPPSKDFEQNLWKLYTQDTNSDTEMPQTTVNPLLERINEFLIKAKRQLDAEFPTTTTEDDTPSTTTATTDPTTSSTDDAQENVSTADPFTPNSDVPEDSNGDLTPSSPAPIPEEPADTDELITTSKGPSLLYQPSFVPDSQPPPFPIGYASSPVPPPVTNDISSFRPSTPDHFYPDYSVQQGLNQYFYNPASILRRRMMIPSTTSTTLPPPPSQDLYVPPQDAYWNNYDNSRNGYRDNYDNSRTGYPNNYDNNMYNTRYNAWNNYNPSYNQNYNPSIPSYNQNFNQNYNPYTSSRPSSPFGYYLRPQRQVYVIPQSPSRYAGLASSSIDVAPYGNELNDYSSPVYNSFDIPKYPSLTSYRQPYEITNSLNNMYAPMYPYQQYKAIQSDYF